MFENNGALKSKIRASVEQTRFRPDIADLRRRVQRYRRRRVAARVATLATVPVLALSLLYPLGLLGSLTHRSTHPIVPRAQESPVSVVHTDAAGDVSIVTPSDWTFVTNPVPQLVEPTILFATSPTSFPTGGDCGPDPALQALPSDGAFVWLTEIPASNIAPQDLDTFPAQPLAFSFTGQTPTQPECASVLPSYGFRFTTQGRYFELRVAFGSSASQALRAKTALAISSVQVSPKSG